LKKQSQFVAGQMNVSVLQGKDYENLPRPRLPKSKPDQTQSRNPSAQNYGAPGELDYDYAKRSQFARVHMNISHVSVKSYGNTPQLRLQKTNQTKPMFQIEGGYEMRKIFYFFQKITIFTINILAVANAFNIVKRDLYISEPYGRRGRHGGGQNETDISFLFACKSIAGLSLWR
jgi:hypothetical protein